MRFIIYNPKTELFSFFINSLIYELINTYKILNIHHINKPIIEILPEKDDIILIIINPHFIYDYPEISLDIDNISKKFKYKILYITEPINFLVEKKVYIEIINRIKPYCLWTYTISNFNKINSYSKVFKIYPSFNECINFIDINNIFLKSKNISKIVFIGNITQNRIYITNKFNKNNQFINYNNVWDKDGWTDILNNNLFYLNIHRRKGCNSFETFRINSILANGGFIFSDRCNKEEEEYYGEYNIIFIDEELIYESFIKYIENINYNDIYEKSIKFRNKMINNNFELDKYFKYHESLV